MNAGEERSWVPLFLQSLRRMARSGCANVEIAAHCAGVSEASVHKFKSGKGAAAKEFRVAVSVIMLQSQAMKKVCQRRTKTMSMYAED